MSFYEWFKDFWGIEDEDGGSGNYELSDHTDTDGFLEEGLGLQRLEDYPDSDVTEHPVSHGGWLSWWWGTPNQDN